MPGDGAVLALGDEGEVEDPDQAAVDQLDQVRRDLAVGLAAGPLDQHVVDRAHLVDVVAVQTEVLSSLGKLPAVGVAQSIGGQGAANII